MSILVVGFATDSTIEHLAAFLQSANVSATVLDLGRIATSSVLDVEEGEDLVVTVDNDRYNLSDYTACFSRAYWKDLGLPLRNQALQQLVQAILGFLEHSKALIVNRPSAGSSNGSKLMHASQLQSLGFQLPVSFVVGCPETARARITTNGAWISKGCSSLRTTAEVVDELQCASLDSLKVCPCLFQERLRGFDARVHVVGHTILGMKIESNTVDYRRTPELCTFGEIEVPETIQQFCLAYCRAEGLLFAGFDFKITHEGHWIVLEANPMPGYDYYDRRCDGRISRALVELLSENRHAASEKSVSPFISRDRRCKG